MDLRDLVAYHQLCLNAAGRSQATQRLYLYYEKAYLSFLDAEGVRPTLGALTLELAHHAVAWFKDRQHGRGARGGASTAQMFQDRIKGLGAFGEAEGVYDDNPVRKLRRVKIAKHVRQPYTQPELMALWAACQQTEQPLRDEALFLLLLDTGMRRAEAAHLKLEHVDLAARQVLVMGKGQRERVVPLGDTAKRDGGRAVRALRTYLDHRSESPRAAGRLFVGREGWPLEPGGITEWMARLGSAAGVSNAIPHRLRHTFCTRYLTLFPGDELGLRRIVGHLSKDVLSDYIHFAQNTIAERAGRASIADTLLGTPTMVAALRVAERERSASRLAASRRPASVRPWGQDHE